MTAWVEQPVQLSGRLVSLTPLSVDDAYRLIDSACDREVWKWKLVPRPTSVADLQRLITERMIGDNRWPFAIRRRADDAIIGSTTVANFNWQHGFVENGFTWLERASWGQAYNEDTKLVLLTHLFELVGLERVEWQVDAQNSRSVAALTRLGFTLEGTHRRRHVRPDGSRRDSLMFALLQGEWPRTKAHLQQLVEQRT
jgi:RimJ/RimL family protein N-acetyltransferase